MKRSSPIFLIVISAAALLSANLRSSAAMVALWQFDNSGINQPDATSNNNTATSVNGAVQVFDGTRNSGTMSFDGAHGFLQVADSASLSITGDLTIASWVNLTSIGGFGQWRGIVTKDPPGSGTAAPYQFWFNQFDGRPVYVGGNGAANDVAVAVVGSSPAPGVWEHWAVTLSGSTVSIYRNGVALAMSDSTISTTPIIDGDGPLLIGDRAGAQDMSFLGRMDDVAIFNHALTQTEILTIMAGNFTAYGVPEPTGMLLLGLGGFGSLLRRKR